MNAKFFELPDEKQLRIINAGFEVFSKSDYKKASTEDIAVKAGISKGLLFYYFHNKKSLYLYLFEHAEKLLSKSVMDAHFEEITDIFDLLEYAALKKFEILQKSPDILNFVMRIFTLQNEVVSEDISKKWQSTSEEFFTKHFARMDYTKFKEDINPQEIIQMLLWTAEGYMYDRQKIGLSMTLDELMDKYEVWTAIYKKIAYKEEYLR